jgi:hypothetical protein
METKPSFFTVIHALETKIELTEKFDGVETPRGFKNIELYPHQSTIVKALIDVEDRRVVTVRTGDFDNLTNTDVVIETSALVLSEPFGTGKTIEILGWILSRPIPRALPQHANAITIKNSEKFVPAYRRRGGAAVVSPFKHEIVRKFTGPDALIRPNLIVVGSSVLVQWENAIKSFTDLKVFTVGHYYSLRTFQQLYNEKKLKAFDIILLKNGTFTGAISLPGESASEARECRSLISVIGKMTQQSCWSRVIYDDFDTITIPPGSGAINALFTGYVSATTKTAPTVKNTTITYKNLADAFMNRPAPLNLVLKDTPLFTNFNIRNSDEFVELSTKIPIVNKYRYVYANPDDNYIRLIGAMGEQDADNIMEMLNGDAIGTAADALGIKTNSVADIFSRMLDKKYERYMNDQYVLETIEKVRTQIVPALEPHPEGKRHSATELDAIRATIAKKALPAIKYYSVTLDQMLDEMCTEYQVSKEQNGLAITRVIDNIKEGACQVCCLPLEDMDAFIVRCCGLIVCDVCGIKGCSIQKRYSYKLKAETIYGSCANCKADVYPQTDLIFVDRNFDMEALLRAKGDEKPAEPIAEPEPEVEVKTDENAEPVIEIKNPKLKALLSIIRTGTAEGAEVSDIKIPHLLEGREDIPQTKDIDRKVLVFANFNETLNMVENFLVEQGIEFLRLGGTYKENAATVNKFKTYGKVLLINSQQHCAGINAQFSSDAVFMHKVLDPNIEAQVCGRIQRIGRTCNAHIHYLAYNNERALV